MCCYKKKKEVKLYFLLPVSTYHGSLSLRQRREWSVHARAGNVILGMIGSTVSSLTKAQMKNLHKFINQPLRTTKMAEEVKSQPQCA